jgi:hypothetical protein
MIVDDFDIVRSSFIPAEANSPLVTNPDAPLAGAVSLERLQPVSWWYTQVLQNAGGMQQTQLAQGDALDVTRQLPAALAPPDLFRPAISEALDHAPTITLCVI